MAFPSGVSPGTEGLRVRGAQAGTQHAQRVKLHALLVVAPPGVRTRRNSSNFSTPRLVEDEPSPSRDTIGRRCVTGYINEALSAISAFPGSLCRAFGDLGLLKTAGSSVFRAFKPVRVLAIAVPLDYPRSTSEFWFVRSSPVDPESWITQR